MMYNVSNVALFAKVTYKGYFVIESTQCKKAEELSLSRGCTPNFQVIFYVICLFNRSEDATKNN